MSDEWKTIGHVPVELAVDEEGKPADELFLGSHIGGATLRNGENCSVMSAGAHIVLHTPDRTFTVSVRAMVEAVDAHVRGGAPRRPTKQITADIRNNLQPVTDLESFCEVYADPDAIEGRADVREAIERILVLLTELEQGQ